MGACRRAREGESRTGCDCQGGRAGARATGSGVKCRFSAGRPAEWIETGSARIAVLNRGSFSAGRPAEWIETARADALTRIGQVSPLEDQRSGLKLAHKHTTHKGKVMFLRWKTSGVD